MPSLTLIVPPLRTPRVNNAVLAVTGTLPVPIAGDADTLVELEELDEEPLDPVVDEDAVELPAPP